MITDPALAELSGMVPAMHSLRAFWGINDSGNPTELIQFGFGGKVRRRVPVHGASNVDWEDIAAFEQGGVRTLVIGDIGDNFALRRDVELYLMTEPSAHADVASVSHSIRFTYEDGPRDAESLVVDAAAGQFLILEKRSHHPGLYSLPMNAADGAVARRIATVDLRAAVAQADRRESVLMRSAATSMDLSPDGQRLAVLTYSHLLLFHRATGGWGPALAAKPLLVARLPSAPSMESVCFAPDGIWMAPEGSSVPVYHYVGAEP